MLRLRVRSAEARNKKKAFGGFFFQTVLTDESRRPINLFSANAQYKPENFRNPGPKGNVDIPCNNLEK